jgi:hypothetical protein
MKKLLLSILAATASWVSASTVSLSSTPNGPSVYDAFSALVPNGGLIRVGYLATPNTPSSFVEFGTSTVKNSGVGTSIRPSKVNGSVNNVTEADDAAFNGKDVYVWIYNAATEGASTQSGLFHAVATVFPNDDPAGVGDTVSVLATSLTEYINDPKYNVAGGVQGRFDAAAAANADGSGTGRLYLGGIVPEPSSMGLLALAGLALIRRRR